MNTIILIWFWLLFNFLTCDPIKLKKLNITEPENVFQTKALCFVNANGTVYDLSMMYNNQTDYLVKKGYSNKHVHYNFCQFGHTQCRGFNSFVVYRRNRARETCSLMSNTDPNLYPTWKIVRNATDRIEITLPEGEYCRDNTKYTSTYDIECDYTVNGHKLENPDEIHVNSCHNVFRIRSRHACPDKLKYSMQNVISEYNFILALFLIATGIIICFFGHEKIKFTSYINGIWAAMFIIIFLIFCNVNLNIDFNGYFLILLSSVGIGLIIGWVFYINSLVHKIVLEILLGFVVADFLIHLFAGNMHNTIPVILMYIILPILTVLSLAFIDIKYTFIIGTAGCGGYATIFRGIGIFLDTFPTFYIIDLLDRKEFYQLGKLLDVKYFLLIFFSIFMSCFGALCQMAMQYKKEETKPALYVNEDELSKLE